MAKMPPGAAQTLWEQVKANHAILEKCEGPHDFQRIDPKSPLSKWRCSKCSGTTSGTNVYWYNQGLKHRRGSEDGVRPATQ